MTNTLEKPLVSVITQVGLDHTGELGNTIYKIAHEKAGIIKPGVPVVSQSPELAVKNIIRRAAAEKGCSFTDVSACFDNYRKYSLGMRGEHQLRNAATACEAIKAAGIPVPGDAVSRGLAAAVHPGRFEVLSEKPYWIVGGAHNPDAVNALCDEFNKFTREHRIKRSLVIFGCMKDKDSARMIQLLISRLRGARYAVTAVDYDRAEDPEVLGGIFTANGRGCICCESVKEAFDIARTSGFECVLITGSIYLAGAMRGYFLAD
jgi:dihydrofolate synthase/folylpolyglutamate synthase